MDIQRMSAMERSEFVTSQIKSLRSLNEQMLVLLEQCLFLHQGMDSSMADEIYRDVEKTIKKAKGVKL